MTCGIYKITQKDTGQSYIGLSDNIERRWYDHIHRPALKYSYIDRAIKKHGEDKFRLEIIEELPDNRALLKERERYWISQYNTYEDNSQFNLTPGGDFCPSKVPEIAKKISESLKGRELSEEHRKKLSKANSGTNHYLFGCHLMESTKLKMSHKKNFTGYYRVYKQINKTCKQGFIYTYQYYNDDDKRVSIRSVNIEKLKKKVIDQGLPWYEFKD